MSADSERTLHTYHFDLSHVRGKYANPHVKTPLGTFALKPHTDATREHAAAKNRAIASMPKGRLSRLTHYAEDVAVPTKAPFYMRLHADNGDNSTLPILYGTKVTIPRHHVRAARAEELAFLRRVEPAHFAHFGIRMPASAAKDEEVLDFLADADLVSHLPTDTAGTIAYSHPSLCSCSNRHGAIINDRHILRSKYLAPFASDVAQLGEATDRSGFAVITQMMDMKGEKPATFKPIFKKGGKSTSDVIYTYEISTDFTGTPPTSTTPARPPKYQTGAQLIGSALGGVTNDLRLRDTHWSVNQAHQTARYDSGVTPSGMVDKKRYKAGVSRRAMSAAATEDTSGYEFTINNKTPGHGLQVDTSSITFDTSTSMFAIDVKNTYMRTLGTHVRFYQQDGSVIDKPPSAYPEIQKLFLEIKELLGLDTTEEFLQFVYAVYAIMDIPMPFGPTTVSMLWPPEAASADILFGGIGTSKWDATADMLGVTATVLFQYLVPLLLIPVGAWIEKSTYYKKLMENKGVAALLALIAFAVIVSIAAIFGEGKTAGRWMINQALNKLIPALLSESFDWVAKKALKKLFLEGADVVIGYISVKVIVSEMIDAIPFAGWAAAALGIAATIGAIGETTGEVLTSPATYTLNVTRALKITATVSPDPLHGTADNPAIWPDTATHYKSVLQYKNGTSYTVTGALPVDMSERANPVTVIFDQVPSGGDFQVTFGVYSNTNWLAGNWTSAWTSAVLPSGGATVLAITGSIIENLVPLTPKTQYLYDQKIVYSPSQGHQWHAGDQPAAVLSSLNPKGLDQLVSITANNGAYMLGYAWQAANQNVPLYGTSTPTNGLVYTFQNINMLSNPEASLKFSGVGFSTTTFLAYEQFGPEPLFAAPSSVVADLNNGIIDATLAATFAQAGYPLPDDLSTVTLKTVQATVEWTITLPNGNAPTYQLNRQSDGSVFVYLYPTNTVGQNNFYLQNPAATDANQVRQLRKVILDNTTPFDMYQTQSYGCFATQTLDALVIHPSNYAVGVSYDNHYMEIVPILQAPVADADVPLGTIVSGPGIRQGLMLGPCAVAVTQDGRILILEAINRRIQAFDINGNPVPSFQKAVVATLDAATYAPDLDRGLVSLPLRDAFAAGGAALSQHWQLRDSTNLVDIQLSSSGTLQLALNGAPLSNQWTITNTDGTVYPAVLSVDAVTVTKGDGSTFPMPFSESENLDMGIVGVASIQAFYKAGIMLSQQAVAQGNGLFVSSADSESDLCTGVVPQSITDALATVFVTMQPGTEVISIVTNTVQALDTVWLIADPESDRTYQIEVSADDDTKLNAIELSPFAHLHVAGAQTARIIDYHPNDLASLATAAKTSDEQYLDLATEMKGYMYVLGYTGSGSQVSDYFLDIYDPLGNFLSRTPDTSLEPAATGVNVGRIAMDMWRNMYGLDFEAIAGPSGRVEPSVSLWTPTTPDGGSGAS
jgi:hypothetical protein